MLAALRELDALTLIRPLVDKYLGILGTTKGKVNIKIVDNIGSKWLGRCTWNQSRPDVSLIEVQKTVLSHPVTLERVVAHEMAHHDFYVSMTESDIRLLRLRVIGHHGSEFDERAAKINRAMGENFVTRTSDSEYVRDKKTRPYYLLIVRGTDGRFGYVWGARLTDAAKTWIRYAQAQKEGRLLQSTDALWTACRSRLGSRYVGVCVPKESEHQINLKALYESGKNIVV